MRVKNLVITTISLVIKIAVIIIAITFVAKTVVKAYNYGYSIFEDKPFEVAPGRDVTVSIPVGSSTEAIAEILYKNGVIGDPTLFRIQNFASSYKDELKAGTYALNSSMSAEEIMMELAGVEEESEEETLE